MQASPATAPRAGWQATVKRARIEIESLLGDSPSLRRVVGELVARETPIGRRLAEVALTEHGETPRVHMQTLTYTEDQVLGEWFPDVP